MTTKTKYSSKLIAEWYHNSSGVGIWNNANRGHIRLYSDRAVCSYDYVRWVDNSGNLATANLRITGEYLAKLIALAQAQSDDDADYTDRAMDILDDADVRAAVADQMD